MIRESGFDVINVYIVSLRYIKRDNFGRFEYIKIVIIVAGALDISCQSDFLLVNF